MNDLNTVISTLSPEEQQRFSLYLEKKNKRNDTKNIQLFKLLLQDDLDSKTICAKLYGDDKKGAYHALRKRLYKSVIDFIANTSLQDENSVNMQIIKFILAARACLQHKQYKTAYKILDKAEVLATEHYLFPLLNEIYHTKIEYAYANDAIDMDDLILKFKDNQKKHQLEDQLNIVYATIRKTLNNMTYKGDVVDFQTLLSNTLKEQHINANESLSFKSLYQLVAIIGLSAFVTNDYLNIESFLINTYNKLIKHKNKDKQVYYHIQVLYLIANTLFRNKKFKASQQYLNQMHYYMLQGQKKHLNTFKLKYHLLLSLNLNFSNQQDEAIKLLEPFITKKHEDTESLLDIHLSLVMFYFQKNDYKKANTLLSKFYHTHTWYTQKAGKEWVIKKHLIDILLQIELKHIDLVESRLLSFKRNHSSYLKDINQQRVLIYLGFVEDYYKNPENINTEAFKEKVEHAFDWISKDKEDIFVMSFYAWLKSKMENKSIYHTTLNLIQNVNG